MSLIEFNVNELHIIPIFIKKVFIKLTHKNFHYEKNAFWYEDKNGNLIGPFCNACYHNKGELIELTHICKTVYRCDICENRKCIYIE